MLESSPAAHHRRGFPFLPYPIPFTNNFIGHRMDIYVDSPFLQKKFLSRLSYKGHDFSIENVFLFDRESDILSVKEGFIFEFEFKVGESDFRKDLLKKRHSAGRPNYFFYVVSDESIIRGDYLNYAGIYVHKFQKDGQSRFILIKPATQIRDELITKEELYSLLKKLTTRING